MTEYVRVSKTWLENLLIAAKNIDLPMEVFNTDKLEARQLADLARLLGHIDTVPYVIELGEMKNEE